MSFSRGDTVALIVASVGAIWATFGNWLISIWTRNKGEEDTQAKGDQLRDQRLLQLESDAKAHAAQDDLRFGFLQQGVNDIKASVEVIRSDVKEIRNRGMLP